jgi:hypothetical protein
MVKARNVVLATIGIAGVAGLGYYLYTRVKAKEEKKLPPIKEEIKPKIETDKKEYFYFDTIKWKASNLTVNKVYGVGIYVKEKDIIYYKSERDKFVAKSSTQEGEFLIEATPYALGMPFREGFPYPQVAVIPPGEHKFVLFEVMNDKGKIVAETTIKLKIREVPETQPPKSPLEEILEEELGEEIKLPFLPPERELEYLKKGII